MIKKLLLFILIVCSILTISVIPLFATGYTVETSVPSAILIEADTGKVLFEKDADIKLPPASVTKVMTLLLVMEAIDSGSIKLDDMVTASEKAASMGGSQIYLKVGEQMSVSDLLKSVTIASANDASVALAEYVSGSEEAFVARMNERAKELGMNNTNFQNTNGLDDTTTEHYTTARDIALMSRELVKYDKILEFSSTWMDSVRNGAFGLTNTNRLVRFYNGANGLKTGSTSKAKFCISAAAKRDGMQLICVIMAADTRDIRNEEAKKLLDYGFANYSYVKFEGGTFDDVRVLAGVKDKCSLIYDKFSIVTEKGKGEKIEQIVEVPKEIKAPVVPGDVVGKIKYILDGEILAETDIKALEKVDKIQYFGLLGKLIKSFLLN